MRTSRRCFAPLAVLLLLIAPPALSQQPPQPHEQARDR